MMMADEVSGRFPKFGFVQTNRSIMRYMPFLETMPDCGPLNVKLVF